MNQSFTWPIKVPDWDGKTEVSVVIPFANEGQNVVFTAQALVEELTGFCKFEVLLIDNQSDWYIDCSVKNERLSLHQNLEQPYRIRSRAAFQGPPGSKNDGAIINTLLFRNRTIRYLQFDAKQSHWNAKNWGVVNSKGKYIFFLDAHCIMNRDGLRSMVKFMRDSEAKGEKVGGAHAYIRYMLDSRSLEYRPQKDKFFGYQFCTHQTWEKVENGKRVLYTPDRPYKVCVMSTCGMMTPRTILQELGPWHPEFGSYCGGEGYANFKTSTCGYHHWIVPTAVCWHWAEKRGYSWRHDDYVRNEQIAAYVCGGERALQFCIDGRKATAGVCAIAEGVREKCKAERGFIKSRQVEDLEEYFDRWVANPGTWAR